MEERVVAPGPKKQQPAQSGPFRVMGQLRPSGHCGWLYDPDHARRSRVKRWCSLGKGRWSGLPASTATGAMGGPKGRNGRAQRAQLVGTAGTVGGHSGHIEHNWGHNGHNWGAQRAQF